MHFHHGDLVMMLMMVMVVVLETTMLTMMTMTLSDDPYALKYDDRGPAIAQCSLYPWPQHDQ